MNRPFPVRWTCGFACLWLPLIISSRAVAQGAGQPPELPPNATPPPDFINPDRPGIADGSNVIGPHRFQVEIGVQQELRKDAGVGTRTTFLPTLLRFGINQRLEARIEGNDFTFLRTTDPMTGVSNTAGIQPFSFGFKYHFQDQPAPRKHPSLGTIFRLFPASGSSDFRTHHTVGDLRLTADWAWNEQWSVNPNIGLGIYEDGQGRAFVTGLGAITLNYNATPRINPFVDMGLQAPEERDGKSSLIFDAGIAYFTSRNVQLDISFGTGALGHTPPHPFWSAGISVRF